jgi:hypothetical protein
MCDNALQRGKQISELALPVEACAAVWGFSPAG